MTAEKQNGLLRGVVAPTIRKNLCGWFITPLAGGDDVFVHFTAIDSRESRRKLLPGQIVEYRLMTPQPARGPKAEYVRVISGGK